MQYYIWHGDHVGYLLFEALWQAAERGVRVRLLLDDINTAGSTRRSPRSTRIRTSRCGCSTRSSSATAALLDFVTDFARLNRRMHNKSFTADNQATIVGGRNIGDEYFGAGAGVAFADLDVLAVGPVVREVSTEFDRLLEQRLRLPGVELSSARRRRTAARDARGQVRGEPRRARSGRLPRGGARDAARARAARPARLPLEWAAARGGARRPGQDARRRRADRRAAAARSSMRTIGEPEKQLDLVSPYFVPGERRHRALAALARRGVTRAHPDQLARGDRRSSRCTPATRSAARTCSQAGVRLYELKPTADDEDASETGSRFGSELVGSSLHAKTLRRRRAAASSSARSTSTRARPGSTPRWAW